jgi:O-antigen/teichoic acid export membrane protein
MFKRFYSKSLKSDFVKNTFVLTMGTGIGQFIALLASPILTRFYTPSDFGLFAVFTAIVSILLIITTGQYELAITLPKKDDNAILLVISTWFIGTINCSLLFLLAILLKNPILNIFNLTKLPWVIILIPVAVFIYTIYQPIYYLFIRNKNFKLIAITHIISIVSTIFLQIFIYFTPFKSYGLIIPFFISTAIVFLFLLFILIKNKQLKFNYSSSSNFKKSIKSLLVRYKDFPIFNMPSLLINIFANQLPNLLFNNFFSSAITGYYTLTNRVLSSPTSLISKSILDVFKERASRDYRETGSCRNIYIKTLKALVLSSIVPFIILFFTSPIFFPIIFGEKWIEAGKYAQILSILFFFRFIISPLTYIFIIAEKQKTNFLLQTILLVISFLSIYLGYIKKDIYIGLTLFSLSYSLWYLLNLALTYKLSKAT